MVLRGPFVLVDQASEKPLPFDPLRVEVRHRVGRPRWAKLPGPVRPSTVVVPDVLGEYSVQLQLAQDQHAIGELGSDGEHEPFGVAVRAWAARRDLDCLDAYVSQDGVEGGRELACPVADEKPELVDSVTEGHREVADLLGGPPAVRIGRHAEDVDVAAVDLEHEEHVDLPDGERAVDVEVDPGPGGPTLSGGECRRRLSG